MPEGYCPRLRDRLTGRSEISGMQMSWGLELTVDPKNIFLVMNYRLKNLNLNFLNYILEL
jgi:hypothetical protein